ncbi:MAG: YgiT-type zinc finger protein [Candidatus Omnitrophota bacterium]
MNCHNCGGKLEKIITNLPFKVKYDSIIVIKKLPILQCENCNEYVIEDHVMEKVDGFLGRVDQAVELEIFSYAV